MAKQVDVNSLLSGILTNVRAIRGEMDESSSKGSKNSNAAANTTSKIKGTLDAASSAAGAIKTLSTIEIKDIAKIMVIPFDKIAYKIKDFTKILAGLTKAESTRASQSLNAFSSLLNTISNLNMVKLYTQLLLFPSKQMSKFVGNVKTYIKEFLDLAKNKELGGGEEFQKKVKALKEAIEAPIELAKSYSKAKKTFKAAAKAMGFAENFINAADRMTKVLTKTFSATRVTSINKAMLAFEKITKKLRGNVLATALLGMVSVIALPLILIGFGAIALTIKGYDLISKVIQFEFGGVAKAKKDKDLRGMTEYIGGTVFILIASMAVGAFFMNAGGWKALGLGFTAVGTAMLGFIGIAKLVEFLGGDKRKAKNKSNLIGVLAFAAGSILILAAALGVGLFLTSVGGFKPLMLGLGAVLSVVLSFGLISFALGTFESTFKKAIIPAVLVIGLAGISIFMTREVIKLGKAFQEGGGWKQFASTMGAMGALVAEFAVLAAGIAVLATNPLVGIALGVGTAILIGIGGAMHLIAKSALDVVTLSKTFESEDFTTHLGNFKSYVEEVVPVMKSMADLSGKIEFKKIRKLTRSLGKVLDSMSKFADILAAVGGKKGYMRSIKGYDGNGNPIYDPEGINITETSNAIGEGFSIFAKIVMEKLSEVSEMFNGGGGIKGAVKSAKKAAKIGAASAMIASIMDPVSQFVECLKAFSIGGNGKLAIVNIDDEGKVHKEIIDINAASKAIAEGFSIFASEVSNGFNNLPNIENKKKSLKNLTKNLNALNLGMANIFKSDAERETFVKNAKASSEGIEIINNIYIKNEKSLNKIIPELTKNHTEFISKLNKGLKEIKDPLKTYTDAVERLADALDKLREKTGNQAELVLTLDESTVTNTTYNVDKNGFSKIMDEAIPKIGQEFQTAIGGMMISVPAIEKGTGDRQLSKPYSITVTTSGAD